MSQGQPPYYGGGMDPFPPSAAAAASTAGGEPYPNPGGTSSTTNSVVSGGGFGGGTMMGGQGYVAGQRPQFGSPQASAGTMPPQSDYYHSAAGTMNPDSTSIWQQQQQQQQPPPPNPTTEPTTTSMGYSPYAVPSTTMYNYQNNGPPATSSSAGYPSTPGMGGGYPAGTGSITRFAPTATAAPTSSTPASFTGPGVPLYPPSSSSPYNFQPPPQPAAAAPINMAGMSFAQRSAMLQQQREQGGAGAYGGGPPQASSQAFGYGGQVQQQQQQPQPPSQPPMNVRPSPQQQQQRQQQQQKPPPQQGPVVNMAGMTFAQRSALMRQTQTTSPAASNVYGGGGGQGGGVPQYPQQQPQQQQQQQYGGASTASVASLPQSNVYSPQRPQPQPAQQQQQHIQYRGGTMPPTAGGAPTMMMPSQQQQQQQQQQQYGSGGATNMNPQMQQPGMMTPPYMQPPMPNQPPPTMMVNNNNNSIYVDPPEVISQQNRLLTDATRKVQEHAYYMKQAMERHDLPTVLDRAAQMVGELGEHAHSHHHHQLHPPAPGASGTTTALSPKNYYELHLRALEELPTLEDYLLGLAAAPPVGGNSGGVYPPQQQQQQQMPQANMMFGGMTPVGGNNGMMSFPPQLQQNNAPARAACTMRELYDYVQYCPNVLSRLYLQICAASALIRSGEVGTRWVLKDIIEAVKCVQNPVRGLFLRHYLLQAIRDKLPNEPILPTMVVPYGMTAPPVLPSGTPTTTEGDAPAMEVADTNVTDERMEKGTVKDSYEFILANFVQMNKLWVRIKHLPGDIKSKDIRRRREKDRNELRILVGTNLVRLSALDSVTSQIYGQVILPTVLDHIIISEDPLAQAYLIDCIVQVFPDEYHIETMPILLAACPKLRDKVNIRTILHSLMERLANYLADEELLDEADSNQVKRQMAQDSFRMMDECVQSVYNARGPKLQAKEVIRLQTALLSFSMKCYRGNLEQITLCLDNCVVALQQARANQALMQEARNQFMDPNAPRVLPQLEEVATRELEKLLSIPLDELALGVLTLDHYADLISFLPWTNRRQVALTMLEAVSKAGKSPASMKEIEELLSVIAPVLRDEHETSRGQNIMAQQQNQAMQRTTDLMAGLGVSYQPSFGQGNTGMPFQDDPQSRKDAALVSKLIHLLDHQDTDIHFAMLQVARSHFNGDRIQRTESPFTALVFASLKLAKRIVKEAAAEIPTASGADAPNQPTTKNDDSGVLEGDQGAESGKGSVEGEEPAVGVEAAANPQVGRMEKSVTSRRVFVFVQEAISVIGKGRPETAVKLYLEAALTADRLAPKSTEGLESFGSIAYEFISQSFSLYEENAGDSKLQSNCIVAMVGTLLACRSLSKVDYESLVLKVAQYSAKLLRKPEQCAMVAQCSHLFYVVCDDGEVVYSNPPRSLECLQRALKLADACTNSNPAHVQLFVDLLEHYLFFFEKKHPSISGNYITGLVALIKEHTDNLGHSVGDSKAHFVQIVARIKEMKEKEDSKERFASIDISSM